MGFSAAVYSDLVFFDVVVCYSTLHHLYDLKVAVNEMGRVTNKGGTVYIDNDPNYFFYKASIH